jgi:hypothetical protein
METKMTELRLLKASLEGKIKGCEELLEESKRKAKSEEYASVKEVFEESVIRLEAKLQAYTSVLEEL